MAPPSPHLPPQSADILKPELCWERLAGSGGSHAAIIVGSVGARVKTRESYAGRVLFVLW